MGGMDAFAPSAQDAEQTRKDARLRGMIFSLVVQNTFINNPDKALEKAKEIFTWIKEGK